MNYTEKTKLVNDLCGAGLMLLLFEVFYGLTDSAFTVFKYNLQNVVLSPYRRMGINDIDVFIQNIDNYINSIYSLFYYYNKKIKIK